MNWDLINSRRVRQGPFAGDDSMGMNGAFMFEVPGESRGVVVIASDQGGWKHVSVSFGKGVEKTPKWEVMCYIKDIFFDPEECAMQLHPPRSEYVNHHPGTLHLWAPLNGEKIPRPPLSFV